jgi:membrane protein implicated in regulation of membrane protease activity
MDAVTMVFLGIGCLSLLLLLLSLVGGGHLHLGHLHVGHLHTGHAGTGGGKFTLPGVAAFVGAFGFGGAITAELAGHSALIATGVGLVAAIPASWAAGRLVDAAVNMSTDATPTSADVVGATGIVISPVPVGGYGEVRLTVGGQPVKFNARADEPLAIGTPVFVIEVPTPTSVLVERTPQVL